MFRFLASPFTQKVYDYNVVKIDPYTGFAEFPDPSDVKKHLLPVLIDEEETKAEPSDQEQASSSVVSKDIKATDYWMPDKLCKVCYGCEEQFTMFRRRHHCRMCGQIFCHTCSNYSIDGSVVNITGLVRACRLCHDQVTEGPAKDASKLQGGRSAGAISAEQSKRAIENRYSMALASAMVISEDPKRRAEHLATLQRRASDHLEELVLHLMKQSAIAHLTETWHSVVVYLVREVITSVDPDVRKGDAIDIRPYVKLKIIPGGSLGECRFIDGVVFRKNVCHKKMGSTSTKANPKILLLGGAIEYQRADNKLSSMDTLIEQEDRYLKILVEKIMSLQPDIILVGKSVSRVALDLLCQYDVVVMQNVKQELLDRISRMTGGITLSATDHTIQQYSKECLGSCAKFSLWEVTDDPERLPNAPSDITAQSGRTQVVKAKVGRGSTYAYLEGCPADKGCTLLLRGADRFILSEVRHLVSEALTVAYSLRLEVAYYSDRCASLPESRVACMALLDDDSDDEGFESISLLPSPIQENAWQPSKFDRWLLSSSLDIDFRLPYRDEIRGLTLNRINHKSSSASRKFDQSLFISTILIGEGGVQKSKSFVKLLKYYTQQDIAFGRFLVDNCFQLTRDRSSMADHTFCFWHRNARVDISVRRTDGLLTNASTQEDTLHLTKDVNNLPILVSVYCKECKQAVSSEQPMSDETWKMSFGKFLEMSFYNRSARSRLAQCEHSAHEAHQLICKCEPYEAKVDVVPIRPFSVHIREVLESPIEFFEGKATQILLQFGNEMIEMADRFFAYIASLERDARNLFASSPENQQAFASHFRTWESDIVSFISYLLLEIVQAITHVPDVAMANMPSLGIPKKYLNDQIKHLISSKSLFLIVMENSPSTQASIAESTSPPVQSEFASVMAASPATSIGMGPIKIPEAEEVSSSSGGNSDIPVAVSVNAVAEQSHAQFMQNPLALHRMAHLKVKSWNIQIEDITAFFGELRSAQSSGKATGQNTPMTKASSLSSIDEPALLVASSMPVNPGEKEDDDTVESGSFTQEDTLAMAASPVRMAAAAPSLRMPSIKENIPLDDVTAATPMPESDVNKERTNVANFFQSLSRGTQPQYHGEPEKKKTPKYRIARAIQYLFGESDDSKTRGVNIGSLARGRLAMPIGRKGEVIAVQEDVVGSIIAYSLASADYRNELQAFYGADTEADLYLSEYAGARAAVVGVSPLDADDKGIEEDDENFPSQIDDNFMISPVRVPADQPTVAEAAIKSTTQKSTKSFFSAGKFGSASSPTSPTSAPAEANSHSFDDNAQALDFGTPASKPRTRPPSSRGQFATPTVREDQEEPSFDPVGDDMGFRPLPEPEERDSNQLDKSKEYRLSDAERKSMSVSGSVSGSGSDGLTEEEKRSRAGTKATGSSRSKQLLSQRKIHVTHNFVDYDEEKDKKVCKFVCTTYWAGQFEAIRAEYLGDDENASYIRSLALSQNWATQGGKSKAKFAKTADDRFVVKMISNVELQMFLEFAPGYFEYMNKAYYSPMPSVLCKIFGVYKVASHNKETDKRLEENVVVMENIFYQRNITRIFDLKGSSLSRKVELGERDKMDSFDEALYKKRKRGQPCPQYSRVLLDGNLMDLTNGRPVPLKLAAKNFFRRAVFNDTHFLSNIINVVDYSILVGFDEDSDEIVVGIIDYLRQYDTVKKLERIGKSVMLGGQGETTIIQPKDYRKRFIQAMEKYFVTVPDKWISDSMALQQQMRLSESSLSGPQQTQNL